MQKHISIFWKQGKLSIARGAVLTVIASLLIAASAQIVIPFWPVPFTLQTFAVVFIGMSVGWRIGGLAVLTYLAEGASGLPVFFGFSSGLAHLLGPTGGYLMAFLPAVLIAGWLVEHGAAKNIFTSFVSALFALSVILVLGTGYLAYVIGFAHAYQAGMKPFLLGELLKAIMLAVLIPNCWRHRRNDA